MEKITSENTPTRAQQHDAARHTPAKDRAMQEEIGTVSPEGRPADPHVGKRQIYMLIGGAALLAIVVVAALVAFLELNWAIAAAAGFGILVLGFCNPVIWAAIQRGKEREPIVKEHDGEKPPKIDFG